MIKLVYSSTIGENGRESGICRNYSATRELRLLYGDVRRNIYECW